MPVKLNMSEQLYKHYSKNFRENRGGEAAPFKINFRLDKTLDKNNVHNVINSVALTRWVIQLRDVSHFLGTFASLCWPAVPSVRTFPRHGVAMKSCAVKEEDN